MINDTSDTKPPIDTLSMSLIVILGCLLTCCLSVFINNLQYGKNIVKLDKNLDNYKNEDAVPINEVNDVNMMQILKWSILPSIQNLIIWGLIIIFIYYKLKPKLEPVESN